ncbi:helicase HerA-like domain-containing protein [Capnocytophaga sp. ARDL2]|uniref:helicase HerA-like domain-containing protein n=1 Tax=Capnocytophaga sp. ARDL2 TaxID=3238809 RepID=UPI00355698BF
MSLEQFKETITNGYTMSSEFITVGGAMYDKEIVSDLHVNIPLKTIARHGLIAGATGTGKTKTIQVLCEQLSQKGIPVLMMDIKGDFSGIAQEGTLNSFIENRLGKMNLPFNAKGFPVELLTISKQNGVKLRATISEFGPVLLSRILDVNETQSGVLSIVFKYCDDNKLPLIDIKDLKKVLHALTNELSSEIETEYGKIAKASTSAILRKIVELEQQGADLFFGEPSFDIHDLMRIDENGKGYINILRLTDIQDKPKLFSTFMLCLLAEIYNEMPEQGDRGRPELVLFIDEAHLIFKEASKTLLEQIETIVKLIRSKGVGVYFITQNPTDIPNGVLAQLGLKIQHALKAFTEKDRKAIKTASENFPSTPFFTTNEVITQMGIGEALVTALNEKGIPTPLVVTALRAPESRMDVLQNFEIEDIINKSFLAKKYNQNIDSYSAHEMLTDRFAQLQTQQSQKQQSTINPPINDGSSGQQTSRQRTNSRQSNNDVGKQITKVLTSATFIRGAFGVLNKIFSKK